jgi:hypothetical protein
MYHILYRKCTVLILFSCVFTVFPLQKHVLSVHFTCIQKYTCTIYYTGNAQFWYCFHVFSLCFHCRNMYFWYISHVYQNTPVPYTMHEMHSFASVFMCFHCRNMYFWYISHVYQKKHVSYILHEMHSFASVFMFFHYVFTAETCTFGTFHMYTKIHMYHIIYMKWTVLLVFSCVFTVFSLCFHCRNMYFWYISHVYKNIHVPYIQHEMHSFASVFMCFHCVFTAETFTFCTFHTYIPKYTCTIYSTWNAQSF